jgi:archaemetzincin
MSLQNITLISFGLIGREILENTASAINQEFQYPVNIVEGHLHLSEFYDSARRQYNGNLLLKHVDSLGQIENSKTLGLFNVDLFIPILTFIFGQAFLGGRSGITSTYRLNNELYGIPVNNLLMKDRLNKETIHELGHMFGLIHCQNQECVMRSSSYVEDIDQKGIHFCVKCRSELKIGSD